MRADAIAAQIRAIAEHVRAVDPDDDQLLADMLEAETDLDAALDMLIAREAEVEAMTSAIDVMLHNLRARKDRLGASKDAGRAAMQKLVEAAGVRKVERPAGTVSISKVAPRVIGDDVDALPDSLVRLTRAPNKTAIKEALQAGDDLPGWHLSNGGETVTVRRR